LVVDDYSRYCWRFFLKKKDKLQDKVDNFIKELRNAKMHPKFWKLDDTGKIHI
jgi:hypothetical protein